MNKFLILTILLLTSNVANAYELEKAKNNMSHELSNCSAYYLIVAQAMDNHTPNAGDGYRQRGEESLNLASLLLNQKTVMARFQLTVTDMLEEIDHNFSNTSRLKIKHHKICFTDLDTRMQYWRDK
jgi:hypothetical protein